MSSSGIVVGPNIRGVCMGVAALGLSALGAGLALSPTRGFSSLLINGFFFLTLALGGAVFLALNSVANAGWYTVFKRIPEAFASYVPVGAASLLVVLAGLPSLYLWARPGVMETDHLLHQKAAFLNAPGFAIRMAVMLAIWAFFTWRLRRNSLAQDSEASPRPTRRNVATSAVFLVLFAITFCLASFDWLMSLEPHWFSTIYGLYNIAGMLASSVAAITVAVVLMKRSGLMKEINTSHLHDLGKLMFGFATLWAYLWFSQFLLIWYSNIPEETVYFIHRMHGGWEPLFYLNLALNWALPFVLLLPKPAKRNPSHLCFVAGVMLAGRWLDLHLMISPANMPEYAGVGVWDAAGLLGLGALFVLTVTRTMGSVPLIARHDPYLVESLHHHT
ncbi:quinol:cytochrome c oxidoreductase quinone-binding subunit 2 [Archangium gephyra]|uniref:Quinol:cytochrome c oxidoreductase quinone-binding subunit 2 n=1 Tax=Archangium gephyra TaxID=48 RepID=A0AAC8Q737_9BACT|nr:hypothetical protein [Archangium gephyra]AKJ01776.1 Hypothetical protein AA314_03402 [Archangium gephyra]REG34586.1 quinol:cytochrome c oxidoreductase quinone-binding subunit 2 [Archangium gephyra]